MTKVAIVGAGSFGTALACAARRARLDVSLWARESEVADAIQAGRGNPVFLADIALEPGIRASTSLKQTLDGADFVLMAPPAQHLRSLARRMTGDVPDDIPVIACSKGIERGTCALMPEVIAEVLPRTIVCVLAGPSFAREIALNRITGVTLASTDSATAARIAGLLGSAHFRVYASRDPVSATVGGAYKNVLAIATGIALARGMGENVRGLLIARGLREMAMLARAKGGDPVNLLGLAGSGDVTLTCMGTQSRNTTFGMALGAGRRATDILAERNVVTEGVHTAQSMFELGRKLDLRLPLVGAVNRIVNEGADIDGVVAELLAHPTGCELPGLT